MLATMSSMLALLSFIVIVVPAAALYYTPKQAARIGPYSGNEEPSGYKFEPSWDLCVGAISRVRRRTPSENEHMSDCEPHIITYEGRLTGTTHEVRYLVKCSASPAAVWVGYDGILHQIYYVPHRNDEGCDFSDPTLLASAYVILNQ